MPCQHSFHIKVSLDERDNARSYASVLWKQVELAIKLIDLTLKRGYQIVDAGYGSNTSFLLELENRQLKYLGELAKNCKITVNYKDNF